MQNLTRLAFVVHESGRARARGLQSFYRFKALFISRDEDAGSAHDGADELSTERRLTMCG